MSKVKYLIPIVAADWYNYAAAQDRQVVRNNRCGSNQTDFVTPEYATFSAQLVNAFRKATSRIA